MTPAATQRVLSGMRPTGGLHLGHYHGVLKNWLRLQHEYECFFFVADWHALTTHYEDPRLIADNVCEMAIDWLACGVDPKRAVLFVQSQMPAHAELYVLLSMMTPLSWLERVPTYKDQRLKLKDKDLSTYGFLGYPLLQSADILLYRAAHVPIGEDQVAHVELTREVARRFNFLYGREADYEARAKAAIKRLGKANAARYAQLRTAYSEQGDAAALACAQALIEKEVQISTDDRERLAGYLEGRGRTILTEPQPLLTPAAKLPGLDGQKMSKSYNNTIGLREAPDSIVKKIRTMPTDPARVRRTDPGEPERCPVWALHKVYSDAPQREWVQIGCRSAGIGCIECKQPVIDAVVAELAPIRARAVELAADLPAVKAVLTAGADRARAVADDTLAEARAAMGLDYSARATNAG